MSNKSAALAAIRRLKEVNFYQSSGWTGESVRCNKLVILSGITPAIAEHAETVLNIALCEIEKRIRQEAGLGEGESKQIVQEDLFGSDTGEPGQPGCLEDTKLDIQITDGSAEGGELAVVLEGVNK